MKVRQGFVSNSSSSSFLVGLLKNAEIDDLGKAIDSDFENLLWKEPFYTEKSFEYCKRNKKDCVNILTGKGSDLIEGESGILYPKAEQRICDEINEYLEEDYEDFDEECTPETAYKYLIGEYYLSQDKVEKFLEDQKEIAYVRLCQGGDGGTDLENQLYSCINVSAKTENIQIISIN